MRICGRVRRFDVRVADGKSFDVLGDCVLAGEARKSDGQDHCAEVVNVLQNPWEVRWICVKAIRVFSEAVALKSAGDSDV